MSRCASIIIEECVGPTSASVGARKSCMSVASRARPMWPRSKEIEDGYNLIHTILIFARLLGHIEVYLPA